jgi:AraC family transcriptional regulator
VPRLDARTLYRSDLLSVSETRCVEPVAPTGVERVALGPCLVFTRAGTFRHHTGPRARTPLLVDTATAILLNHSEPYRVSSPTGGAHACTLLTFAPAVAVEVAASLDPGANDHAERPFMIADAVLPAHVVFRHHQFCAHLRRGVTGELGAQEEALNLLHDVVAAGLRMRGGVPGRRRSVHTKRVHRDLAADVRALLGRRPSAAHPLVEIAAALDSSPFHVARIFRQEVGMPIHRYLLQLRLTLALERLADTTPTIGVLALDLGFHSHSHFTSAFRRAYGVTPETARRQLATTAEVKIKRRLMANESFG